jgi:hypothetical protein
MSFIKKIIFLTSVLILTACGSSRSDKPTVNRGQNTVDETYDKEEITEIAGDFFGETSASLAKVIEKAFADKGRPIGYIKGTEGGGAFIIGARWGSGKLSHRIEGDSQIYWRGPSIGVDFGGNVSKTFALVYNLHDVEELYGRFPAVEGSLYFVGGVGLHYIKKGNIIIAPIRVGVGFRAGVNLGYLRFSKTKSILPF